MIFMLQIPSSPISISKIPSPALNLLPTTIFLSRDKSKKKYNPGLFYDRLQCAIRRTDCCSRDIVSVSAREPILARFALASNWFQVSNETRVYRPSNRPRFLVEPIFNGFITLAFLSIEFLLLSAPEGLSSWTLFFDSSVSTNVRLIADFSKDSKSRFEWERIILKENLKITKINTAESEAEIGSRLVSSDF